jgi:hypothetical protein
LLALEGGRPEGARDGECSPFDEGLSQEGRALPAPMHPAGVAAAFGDRSEAAVALQIIGLGEALALLAEGGQEPRAEDRAGGGEAVEDGEVRMRRRALGDLAIEGFDRLQRRPASSLGAKRCVAVRSEAQGCLDLSAFRSVGRSCQFFAFTALH